MSAVVLHYSDLDDTARCVSSLRRSDDLDLEVIVVDNGPTGESHDALVSRLGPQIRALATGSNLGYAGGNNIGIRDALERDADLVWVLNPDTEADPGTLTQLRAVLDDLPDVGMVGPRLLLGADEPRRIWSDGGLVDDARWGAARNLHAGRPVSEVAGIGPRDVAYVPGASMLVRRELLEDVGLLPEEWFLYFEETDYCRRAQRAGWRTVVDSRAQMTHHKRSSGDLPAPYYLYYMTRNRIHFAARHYPGHEADAAAHFDEVFVQPWRSRVAENAPSWVETFDRLVEMALRDAQREVWGRQPEVERVAPARRGA